MQKCKDSKEQRYKGIKRQRHKGATQHFTTMQCFTAVQHFSMVWHFFIVQHSILQWCGSTLNNGMVLKEWCGTQTTMWCLNKSIALKQWHHNKDTELSKDIVKTNIGVKG